MLKNDEILIIGKIGPKISIALSRKYGKLKFLGSQSLLTLSVYKVNFYLYENSELVKIKESKFLYSFYPIIRNYQKYKYTISAFKIINGLLPTFFPSSEIYKITIDYLKSLIEDSNNVEKLYLFWLYKVIYSLNEIDHLLHCKGCGLNNVSFYVKGNGMYCNKCLNKGDFVIKNYELEFLRNLNNFSFETIKSVRIDVQKFIEIFEDSILNVL
ncbi:MAG: DNA repair protein RecO [candidate division WOR-3 bacterium]